ncbi:MAG: hypothetical protein R2752_11840 [Vicinamibacterales bacterium]
MSAAVGVRPAADLTVVKIGGSVLTGEAAYVRAAEWLACLAAETGGGVVVVVSAESGMTDSLLDLATRCAGGAPDASALDLLWSTGERRSVALLTLALRRRGVMAVGLAEHEVGLTLDRDGARPAVLRVNPLAIRASAAAAPVVVVPGFLATAGGRVVTLGRGGSDWTAVQLAAGLGARRCLLIKDVDGYFSEDPRHSRAARLIESLSHDEAIGLAEAGCQLVQTEALRAARAAELSLIVRSFDHTGTLVSTPETTPGVFLRIS